MPNSLVWISQDMHLKSLRSINKMDVKRKPTFYFDYVYFIIAKTYFRWDGSTGITAVIIISMIQSCLIGDLLALIITQFFNRSELAPFSKQAGYFGVFIVFLCCFMNYRKYDGKYKELRDYWSYETRSVRFVKGFLVIISIIIPWLPMIIIGATWQI